VPDPLVEKVSKDKVKLSLYLTKKLVVNKQVKKFPPFLWNPNYYRCIHKNQLLDYTRVYPKVSGLAVWSENCKWYSCHQV
jgi:hypothetical protein